jgi:hypothetical protein
MPDFGLALDEPPRCQTCDNLSARFTGMPSRFAVLLALVGLGAGVTAAQELGHPPSGGMSVLGAAHPNWPAAKPEDVSSAANIVAAYYDVLSGSAGTPRDWQRFRSLFHPDAQYVWTNHWEPKHSVANIMSLDAIVERLTTNLAKADVYEKSVEDKTEISDSMVNVWSKYETRTHAADTAPIRRGVNSFQIENDGDRYWIVQVMSD